MTETEKFIRRLEELKEGELSRLRRLAGRPLDETLPGFDLFTGLWWPLRKKNRHAPRREPSWLIAKLYGAFPTPWARDRLSLAQVLGRCEPRDDVKRRERFRRRFDALLQSPLSSLEPHLRWALSVAADAVKAGRIGGVDWARLLDDLAIWDRGEAHRRGRDIRDIWAEQYLESVH